MARYRAVHDALQERARLDPELKGMGTTMTAAYSLGRDLFITQVGDSRAYRFRDGTLQLLTRDHTYAQMLANEGLIRQQDVARHRLRHVLTSALGGSQNQMRTEIERTTLADGDRLLLCSDGLTDMVEEAEIAKVLGRRRGPKRRAGCSSTGPWPTAARTTSPWCWRDTRCRTDRPRAEGRRKARRSRSTSARQKHPSRWSLTMPAPA